MQRIFTSRLHYVIITIRIIADCYYIVIYCRGKHNVLHRNKKLESCRQTLYYFLGNLA